MATRVRTRIAPSPTGEDLHIGNAYTALINYVAAKQHGGQFIIRIEDTDRTRFVEGSETRILESLAWLGISYDEGPYHQSERLKIYKKYAQDLVANGHAYYCFCTPKRLAQMRKDQEAGHEPPMYDGHCRDRKSQIPISNDQKYVIRLKVPKEGITTFHDEIRGDISFENRLIDDQVILKSDGFPTYHLGVVVDDHLMEITHVIRGEEWISSTPKHILLYQFLEWDLHVYAHMPLLRNTDKSKLSKRKNPVWVSWFKEQGFLPEALLNYLATMAWSFPDGRDVFSVEEMIKEFNLKDVQTTAPIFDLEKLKWMNKQYLMQKTSQEFGALVSTASIYSGTPQFYNVASGTAPLIQPRIETTKQYDSIAGFFYEPPKTYEHSLRKELLDVSKRALEKLTNWTHDAMEQSIRAEADRDGLQAKDVFMELRIAITGKTVGPPLLESIETLGKQETLERIKTGFPPSRE
ncbi:glutamate--tRNA ligase [Candidatus Gottesmanbacteria bacterium]|nr:glutamate--tRNA ligase [Candidatus Gottesmanbacteria bacterium]